MTHVAGVFDQRTYRFRNDDGDESAATWKAAENTAITQVTGEVFRLRIEVQETAGGTANNQTIVLQSAVGPGDWTEVNATSPGVRLGQSQHVQDGTPTTDQLTGGTGDFIAGLLLTETSGTDISFTANSHTEVEWASLLIDEDVPHGSFVQFRVTINGALADTTTVSPSLTAEAAPDEPVDADVAHGLTVGHAAAVELSEADEPVDIAVTHGLTLGHAAAAEILEDSYTAGSEVVTGTVTTGATSVDADVAHGLMLAHSATVDVAEPDAYTAGSEVVAGTVEVPNVTVDASHGVVLGHVAAATAGVSADASHGLTVAHTADVQVSASADVTHGLALGHAVTVEVGAVTATVAHGLTLGHEAVATASAATSVAHGLTLSYSTAVSASASADITHGLTLTHSIAGQVGGAGVATITHGLELGHAVAVSASVTASASHGLTISNTGGVATGSDAYTSGSAVVAGQVGVVDVTADVTHGLTVAHSAEASSTSTTDVSHGVTLSHAADATVGSDTYTSGSQVVAGTVGAVDVTATVAHGVTLSHAVDAERPLPPSPGSITATTDDPDGILVEWTAAGDETLANVAHGLTLAHTADAAASTSADVSHGLSLDHAATGQVGSAGAANIAHGLTLGHDIDASASVTATAGHGLTFTHTATASVTTDVAVTVTHGLALAHGATATSAVTVPVWVALYTHTERPLRWDDAEPRPHRWSEDGDARPQRFDDVDGRPTRWSDAAPRPPRWQDTALPAHLLDTTRPTRHHATTIFREGDNMPLTTVAYGPFTIGEVAEPLLVRVFETLRDGTTQPLELHGQTPAWSATVSIEDPAGTVTSRSATIVDPASLPTDDPDNFETAEEGWVRIDWQDGDIPSEGTYKIQITLDNGTLLLKSTSLWEKEVVDAPAAAVGAA